LKLNQLFRIVNFQVLRFIIAGVIASSINYLTFVLLYLKFRNILFSSYCGYLIGILISFLFAKFYVFRDRSSQPLIKSFSTFCLIYLFGGILMSFIILIINNQIHNYKVSWFFGAVIGSLNNYFGSKYLSFRK